MAELNDETVETAYIFDLGDRLPTMYDAAIMIYNASRKPGNARKKAVHQYAIALRKQWVKSFEDKHVLGNGVARKEFLVGQDEGKYHHRLGQPIWESKNM